MVSYSSKSRRYQSPSEKIDPDEVIDNSEAEVQKAFLTCVSKLADTKVGSDEQKSAIESLSEDHNIQDCADEIMSVAESDIDIVIWLKAALKIVCKKALLKRPARLEEQKRNEMKAYEADDNYGLF